MMIADLVDVDDLNNLFKSIGIGVLANQCAYQLCRQALLWRADACDEARQHLDSQVSALLQNSALLHPEVRQGLEWLQGNI